MNLLQHIAQSRHLLRKSELKVADHVLLDPAAVMHSSMADLAHSVGISEPTIVRFCRAIGCSGFQDLKLKLAQSLAAGASFGQFAIHEDDSVADYSLKIFDTTLHTLMEVREKLDPVALQQAVTAMSQAQRVEFYGFGASGAVAATPIASTSITTKWAMSQAQRVEFYGFGASGAVAADAQHKFFRLLLTAAAYSDPHMQAMSAVTLKPTDVAICISQSGRSKDLLITANLVRESGASLITLCPSQTPLAELSTVNLAIDVHEDTEIYTPLTSRIAHLVVIDVLAMGVAMARGPSLVNHLKSVKRSLRSLRLSPKSVKALDD
ncbi:SIS domain-containing protein [Pseudomonas protegens]|nr:SIS domain-containing protein [Pseudomonas protegens]MBP5150089.1 SIS domain-containing protein [Pseudomonas protegens]